MVNHNTVTVDVANATVRQAPLISNVVSFPKACRTRLDESSMERRYERGHSVLDSSLRAQILVPY